MAEPARRDDDDRGDCSVCGTSWEACDGRAEGRCCEACLNYYGATHDHWRVQ